MHGDPKKRTIAKLSYAHSRLYFDLLLLRKISKSLQSVIKKSHLDEAFKARALQATRDHLEDLDIAQASVEQTLISIKEISLGLYGVEP